MTSEDIKRTTSMADVLSRYGLKADRQGMLSCPFHGADKHASMKIYKDGYHCFACGAHGDIFDFVKDMEHCDFRTAFGILGGRYEHSDKASAKIALQRRKAQQKSREEREKRAKAERDLNNVMISLYRWGMANNPPMSDAWAEYANRLEIELYKHEVLNNCEGYSRL